MLEAEWWQVFEEALVYEQRKMSQVLSAFGLQDFTILWPLLFGARFETFERFYFFKFPKFFGLR
jgi:hypothetical protein